VIRTTIAGIIALLLFIACREKGEPKEIKIPSAGPIPEEAVGEFSGQKAYDHIVKLTEFGPRPPESEGYQKSLAYLEEVLHGLGWKTRRSTFQDNTPLGTMTFTNLLARFSPGYEPDWSRSLTFVVGGHLDTKRYPDIEFLGANDSGSSTGVMLEIARVLSEHKEGALNVELAFFDGEEAILEKMIFKKDGLYGSMNYAKQLRKRKNKPSLGIVIDLVGDPKVDLFVGGDSDPNAVAHTRKAVKTLGLGKAVTFPETSILDDHIPLMVFANLPVLHFIGDFESMTYWHTKEDTLDKITPGALENSGKLTLQVLHQMTTR